MTDRVQPSDLDAERSLLASLMLETNGRPVLPTGVAEGSFYLLRHSTIFAAIVAIVAASNPVDAMTVRAKLQDSGTVEAKEASEILTDLLALEFSSANAEFYAVRVRAKSALRQLIAISSETLRACYEPAADHEGIAASHEAALIALRNTFVSKEAVPFAKLAGEAVSAMLSPIDQRPKGTASGFPDLDGITNGMRAGELTILAARPSMGKSSLAVRIARHVGHAGGNVLAFSLETTARQVAHNVICGEASLDTSQIFTRNLRADEKQRLLDASPSLSNLHVWVDDSPDLTIGELRAKARRFALQRPPSLVIVDYLQLVRQDKVKRDASRQEEVSAISRGLKILALEIGAPVLALAQLNRAVESRTDHRPMLSDLRESGSIEQDADCVLLLSRPGFYPDSTEPKSKTLVQIAKNRNGRVAEVELVFLGEFMRFESLKHDFKRDEEPPDFNERGEA